MRPNTPKTIVAISASLMLLSGCSKSSDEAPASETAADTANTADVRSPAVQAPPAPESAQVQRDAVDGAAPPGLTPNAAPGVAFSYSYAFTLPAKAISGVQQRHAAACERLGAARCQITGMSYRQPREGEVEARLDLLLAPDIAQQFGGESVAGVEQADGQLDTALISGENAGKDIMTSQSQSAALQADLARIEKRLSAKGLAQDERNVLNQRADEIRSQLHSEQSLRQDKEASIATTPMSFAYASEGLFAAGKDPFGKAAATSLGSVKAMAAFVLTFAGLALPWLLLAALVVLLLRQRALKNRLSQLSANAPVADPAAPL